MMLMHVADTGQCILLVSLSQSHSVLHECQWLLQDSNNDQDCVCMFMSGID